jgi:hypothetical protein
MTNETNTETAATVVAQRGTPEVSQIDLTAARMDLTVKTSGFGWAGTFSTLLDTVLSEQLEDGPLEVVLLMGGSPNTPYGYSGTVTKYDSRNGWVTFADGIEVDLENALSLSI